MTTRDLARLKGMVDAGMATVEEEISYRKMLQNGAAPAAPAAPPTAAQPPAAQSTAGTITLMVNREAFDRGWSSGGAVAPERDAILPGVLDSVEMANTGEDTVFFWFSSKGIEPGNPGYWRGSYMADALTDTKSRAGKVRDVLVALGVVITLGSDRVSFPDPRGREADCDWQTVDIKGTRQRRIQGVYAPGERKQSV